MADLGIRHKDRNKLYRCLAKASTRNYRQQISQACFDHVQQHGLSLLLYVVTTLFFQVEQGDDYRKPGFSKEHQLEPQIILGLLVDKNGFPLGLHSFEGNIAETKTLFPVTEAFQAQHKLSKVTVVADAAMLSKPNLEALTKAGYTYIVGSRLPKVPLPLLSIK